MLACVLREQRQAFALRAVGEKGAHLAQIGRIGELECWGEVSGESREKRECGVLLHQGRVAVCWVDYTCL